MRLIDVDALKDACKMADDCNSCPREARECNRLPEFTRMDFCEFLDSAPTVETKNTVVKCAECIHWDSPAVMYGHEFDGAGVRYCGLMGKNMFDWDFCSYAARRSEGAENA